MDAHASGDAYPVPDAAEMHLRPLPDEPFPRELLEKYLSGTGGTILAKVVRALAF